MPSLTPPEDPGKLTPPGSSGRLTPPGRPAPPENPESRDPGPESGLTLLAKLWQRAERPGCVRHSQARAILARHQRMTGDPPLAELLLRRGAGWADIPPARPVITNARPATPAPAPGPARPPGAATSPATGASAPPTARARRGQPHDPPFPPQAMARPVRGHGTAEAVPGSRAVPRRPALPRSPELPSPPGPFPVMPRSPLPGAAPGAALGAAPGAAPGAASGAAPRTPPGRASGTGPATAATVHPGWPLPPAAVTAPPATSANRRDQTSPRPAAESRQGSSSVTVPAERSAPARPALVIATPRPVPRDPAPPGEAGPSSRPGQSGRPVVRAGYDHRDPRPAPLAWVRPAPAPERQAGPARRPVPVVREHPPPGAWHPAPQRPGQLPAAAPVRTPATTARAAADLAGLVAAAVARQNPAGRAGTGRAEMAGSRMPPPEQPARRPASPPHREREPARPAVDVNHIVSTVQRRLMHQMAIERERRGMMR
jgi:hypothetical protein